MRKSKRFIEPEVFSDEHVDAWHADVKRQYFGDNDIDQFETPVEWARMTLSNSLQLAAYLLTKGKSWWECMTEPEYEWILRRAKDKYHTTREFRLAPTDEKVLYLLFLARGVRIGAIRSVLEDRIHDGIKL